jgi:hypothetical protein
VISDVPSGRSTRPTPLGSAPIQHGVRKRREITSINPRAIRTLDQPPGSALGGRFPTRRTREIPGQWPLDLVGALVDLGDLGGSGSFRSSAA